MKTLAAILCLILALASCIPKAIIVAPIAPAVVAAKGEVAAVAASVKRTHSGASETAVRVKAVREGIEEAISHADTVRITKQTGTKEAEEWMDQWKLLTDIRTRNLFAEESAQSTVINSKEAQILADTASASMGKLETSAKQTDKSTADLKAENAKQAPDAALGGLIRKSVWAVVIFLSLGLIAYVVVWIANKVRP